MPQISAKLAHKDEASKRAIRYVVDCVLLAGFVLVTSGCANKVVQASRTQAEKITANSPVPPRGSQSGSDSRQRRVFLDASLSMKGFVHPAEHSRFDEFLDAIGDVLPGCQLYKYGRRAGKSLGQEESLTEQVRFGSELHQPDFYSLAYNPDDLLIEQFNKEDPASVSVIITDGVYSEPQGGTSPPVVQAIQGWLDKGNTFGILILKSRFDGPFYSEHERAMLPRFSVAERPFYAFVFSPTVNAFNDLREKLSRRDPETPMQAILFSDEALSCAPKLDQKLKGLYAFSAPPRVPYYWQMFSASLFGQNDPVQIRYDVACSLSPDYPISELKFEVTSEYYRWEKGAFTKTDHAPTGFKVEPSNEASSAGFVVDFPRDLSSDYGFYHFKLVPSGQSLRNSIGELSTRDDRLEKNGGKTFRFFEFTASLADTHFKTHLAPRAAAAVFVTIENH